MSNVIKLRITPRGERSYILRGYAALDQRMANRKAGEIIRASIAEGKPVEVNFLRVPAAR